MNDKRKESWLNYIKIKLKLWLHVNASIFFSQMSSLTPLFHSYALHPESFVNKSSLKYEIDKCDTQQITITIEKLITSAQTATAMAASLRAWENMAVTSKFTFIKYKC